MQSPLKDKDMPVLYEEDVNVKSLIKYVEELNQNNEKYKIALKNIMEKKQLKQSFYFRGMMK